jgi:hypothetical protein
MQRQCHIYCSFPPHLPLLTRTVTAVGPYVRDLSFVHIKCPPDMTT